MTPVENETPPHCGSSRCGITKLQVFTVIVLCLGNLLNYIDRFGIAGVLTDIQREFDINDGNGGLIHTTFYIFYTISAPVYGYLGDRITRKTIIMIGIFIWSGSTMAGSFMASFGWFLACRASVGIGEASYCILVPTLISDTFAGRTRSRVLAVFFFAIPVGAGLGYMIGSSVSEHLRSWRWSLRVTPPLGALVIILMCCVKEPQRGESEGTHMKAASFKQDIWSLLKNPSFMLTTIGFTSVSFVLGALSWWTPKFIKLGLVLLYGDDKVSLENINFKFGITGIASGITGVPLGTIISQCLIKKYEKIDPIICGVGMVLSIPLLMGAMVVVEYNEPSTYVLCFLGQVSINLSWAIIADILLYVVAPSRRSTAESVQIVFGHALGDAISPYLIGVFSDIFKKYFLLKENQLTSKIKQTEIDFRSLQYALYFTAVAEIIGAVAFFWSAKYLIKDKQKVVFAISESKQEN